MLISYPALFYYDPSEAVQYFVHFPDFKNSATQGIDPQDAMIMASDWLSLTTSTFIKDDKTLPTPSAISTLSLQGSNPFKADSNFKSTFDLNKSFVSVVIVNVLIVEIKKERFHALGTVIRLLSG
jgi:predicted RNase H-like HicB family nuclease